MEFIVVEVMFCNITMNTVLTRYSTAAPEEIQS